LQISDLVFAEDDQNARYRFTMPGAEGNLPQLVLTFVPEPSTACLALLGMLGLVGVGRSRRYGVG
ncbi:MAG: PEP-CTERM sorting domain-containing protein, partial [Pirellulales bacterium]